MLAKSFQTCLTLRPSGHLPDSSVHGFSSQEYWNGLPCHLRGDPPNPGFKPASLTSPVLADDFFFFFFLPLGPPGMSKYRISDLSAVTQSWLTLCHPMDCSPPGSFLHGFLKVRILEWVAITFSRGFSNPRDQTWVSCIAGRFFTV